MDEWLPRVGAVLLVLSALLLARPSYDLFILTPRDGPQMVFFSLVHTWPLPLVLLFFGSWFAYDAVVLFAVVAAFTRLVVQLRQASAAPAAQPTRVPFEGRPSVDARLVRWLAGPPGTSWSVLVYSSALLLVLHFTAVTIYGRWSEQLFADRG